MEKIEEVNKSLDALFSSFREIEGIRKGKLTSILSPLDIYQILINRRWKYENYRETSELEDTVAKECGGLIRCYIAEAFTNKGLKNFEFIPYSEVDISIDEMETVLASRRQITIDDYVRTRSEEKPEN